MYATASAMPHLLVGGEQLVPSEALELYMAHMALLEPCDHTRREHSSWATGFVPPLVVLDVQHKTQHNFSSLTHGPL